MDTTEIKGSLTAHFTKDNRHYRTTPEIKRVFYSLLQKGSQTLAHVVFDIELKAGNIIEV